MSSSDSYESTNIWDHKPRWCQPWSIVLTGIAGMVGSWVVFHWLWFTLGVTTLVILWWLYFLVIYPQAFAKYVISQQNTLNSEQ